MRGGFALVLLLISLSNFGVATEAKAQRYGSHKALIATYTYCR